MNSQEALKEALDCEAHIICYQSQINIARMNSWKDQLEEAEKGKLKYKQKLQQLADEHKFEGGCGKIKVANLYGKDWMCGVFSEIIEKYIYCPDCQAKKKVQEINKEIQGNDNLG